RYALTGHKWFCSAPMSDAFLVLAQAPGGLSCFLLPRWTDDGIRNRFNIQRLKDKLGNRSNASSEVEFDGAEARLLGEEGRGVQAILEMVNHTRLDCVIGSAAMMRQAVVQAMHHCAHRAALGKRLVEQPLMRAVLADLAVESEAATVLMMRLARAYDRRGDRIRGGVAGAARRSGSAAAGRIAGACAAGFAGGAPFPGGGRGCLLRDAAGRRPRLRLRDPALRPRPPIDPCPRLAGVTWLA